MRLEIKNGRYSEGEIGCRQSVALVKMIREDIELQYQKQQFHDITQLTLCEVHRNARAE